MKDNIYLNNHIRKAKKERLLKNKKRLLLIIRNIDEEIKQLDKSIFDK